MFIVSLGKRDRKIAKSMGISQKKYYENSIEASGFAKGLMTAGVILGLWECSKHAGAIKSHVAQVTK